MRILFLLAISVLLLFSSCSLDSSTNDEEVSIYRIEEIAVKNDLPNLLAAVEQGNHANYLAAVATTMDSMAAVWKTEPEKISITGFVKGYSIEEKIFRYIPDNDKLERVLTIPESIIGSFK